MKVVAWRLTVWDENDKEYKMVDIPNHIAQDVDEWLSSLESFKTIEGHDCHPDAIECCGDCLKLNGYDVYDE